MKIYEKIKEVMGLIVDKPYLPIGLQEAKGPFLLHISDTPQEIYPYILRLVKTLRPAYIVHTGDMVDDIKLEILPNQIDRYKIALNKFITGLESSTSAMIYYVMGNHDAYEVVKEISIKGIPLTKGHIMIEGIDFYVNHYHIEDSSKKDYYLYGHSFEPKAYKTDEYVGLNGLNVINVLDLTTKVIYALPYPFATNQFRKMKQRRIGL
ncbi:metallophosphoesterase family protein [Natronincola ferrireducens]|uniref:Calcineurin-like phosphoesterase n=1 Tax=Natronincola ferrireducens TaxID=393762 RepID=A0A1G8ZVF9_9FIRM|nr:metallophosphoesterase [Natronincola ferrireducens]SDK19033.1 Calcineurin-like phosphoesterase [Natronincola ferrireducens]